ncbi:LysR family transcriptional regulator [Vagococcus sp. BWB3-3]|uniref:LysR family transcriptional regulator n=1 Tax=Vagococcus allomyrinae TaxID=2794353 RepID=A0A940P8B5_9ENTE|nr:LysR family transcriptional regulator [Vagococcus allomyrinae]MBP1042920.1 LysR family transcriptional regulator [Vagococcus allomyrinae]
MNLSDLDIYKTIYDTQSLNKTSTLLGYSQSNITARLKAIENEFNTQLFIRSHHGVQATEHGEKLYAFVTQTLSHLNQLKADFNRQLPSLLISELLFDFLILEKKIVSITDTLITIKKTSDIDEELTQRSYDDVFTFNPLTNNTYQLKATELLEVCFFKGSVIPAANPLPILINSDANCPLRQLTLSLCSEADHIIEVDSLENILKLVANGQAISLLPCYLLKNDAYQRNDDKAYNITYFKYQH